MPQGQEVELLACPFCGGLWPWDRATIEAVDKLTFATDRLCPICEDVRLSYFGLIVGSLCLDAIRLRQGEQRNLI
jgi:hypothetical protein